MSGDFHLIDLRSQAAAVQRLLKGQPHEAKLAWLNTIATMPGKTTLENMGAERLGRVVSYQHPDEPLEDRGG